jgi:hypothetical protein
VFHWKQQPHIDVVGIADDTGDAYSSDREPQLHLVRKHSLEAPLVSSSGHKVIQSATIVMKTHTRCKRRFKTPSKPL